MTGTVPGEAGEVLSTDGGTSFPAGEETGSPPSLQGGCRC